MSDDFPSARQTGSGIFRYGFYILLAIVALSLIFGGIRLLTAPARTAVGVVDRVINADQLLQSYRWFHSAHQQILAKQQQIVLAKAALEDAADDRKEARRVELLGLQQGCQNLVGQYNEKSTRADTVIFKQPEKFLPGDWPGDRSPLPQMHDFATCS